MAEDAVSAIEAGRTQGCDRFRRLVRLRGSAGCLERRVRLLPREEAKQAKQSSAIHHSVFKADIAAEWERNDSRRRHCVRDVYLPVGSSRQHRRGVGVLLLRDPRRERGSGAGGLVREEPAVQRGGGERRGRRREQLEFRWGCALRCNVQIRREARSGTATRGRSMEPCASLETSLDAPLMRISRN